MIDASDTFEGTNCFTAYETLKKELLNYSEDLLSKPRIVFCNKIDVEGAYDNAVKIIEEIRKNEPDTICVPISVLNNHGMKEAREAILKMVNQNEEKLSVAKQSEVPFGSTFMADVSADDFVDDETQYPGSEK